MREGVYERYTRLPFAVEEVEGAEHLIVSFPALVVGGEEGAPPLTTVGRRLAALRAHRLFVGADRDFMLGPDNELNGLRTAVALVEREAARLGVPMANVIAMGTSYRGSASLWVGIKAGIGLVVAGAPTIRIADRLARLARGEALAPEVADLRAGLAKAARIDDPDARLMLDRLMLRAALRADHPGEIVLYLSPDDVLLPDAVWFERQLAEHRTLRCRVVLEDYGLHGNIGSRFYDYLVRTLLPITGAATGRGYEDRPSDTRSPARATHSNAPDAPRTA